MIKRVNYNLPSKANIRFRFEMRLGPVLAEIYAPITELFADEAERIMWLVIANKEKEQFCFAHQNGCSKCSNCQNQLGIKHKFCSKCGFEIKWRKN